MSSTISAPQNRKRKRHTAPLVRTIFSGLGVYFFVNLAFLSRKNTNKFGMSTLSCLGAFVALFPSGKSRISPTAQIDGYDSSCRVGCIFTKPSGDSEFGPRELDTQAVFGLGPYVETWGGNSQDQSVTTYEGWNYRGMRSLQPDRRGVSFRNGRRSPLHHFPGT